MTSPSAIPLRCCTLALVVAVSGCLTLTLKRRVEDQTGTPHIVARAPARVEDAYELPPRGPKDLGRERLREYCYPPLGHGAEGRPPRGGLELQAVVLTIRHGDRSAIHSVPGSLLQEGRGFNCEAGDLQASMAALPQRFNVVDMDGKPFPRPFSPPAKECAPGQLTSRGFRQHLALGGHLQQAYRQFLGDFRDRSGVLYVRSTKYTRTIASAAALLTSMLPRNHREEKIDIEVNVDESAEVMHGIGTKKRSGGAGDGGDQRLSEGDCPAMVRHKNTQFDAWQRPPEMSRLTELYGPKAANRSITDFADAMFSASCHGLPLPCGAGGCADAQLAVAVARRADQYYCKRYAGAEGGEAATALAFYPFVAEILGFLQAAAIGKSPPALAVFSGHDTVIAPVLSCLGVYRGQRCRWPPLASRIALELYREPRGQEDGRPDNYFVRAVYNGEALVGMRGCGAKELCPLHDFAAGVSSLLGGAKDWAAACAA